MLQLNQKICMHAPSKLKIFEEKAELQPPAGSSIKKNKEDKCYLTKGSTYSNLGFDYIFHYNMMIVFNPFISFGVIDTLNRCLIACSFIQNKSKHIILMLAWNIKNLLFFKYFIQQEDKKSMDKLDYLLSYPN